MCCDTISPPYPPLKKRRCAGLYPVPDRMIGIFHKDVRIVPSLVGIFPPLHGEPYSIESSISSSPLTPYSGSSTIIVLPARTDCESVFLDFANSFDRTAAPFTIIAPGSDNAEDLEPFDLHTQVRGKIVATLTFPQGAQQCLPVSAQATPLGKRKQASRCGQLLFPFQQAQRRCDTPRCHAACVPQPAPFSLTNLVQTACSVAATTTGRRDEARRHGAVRRSVPDDR